MKKKLTILSVACGLALSLGTLAAMSTPQDPVDLTPSEIQKVRGLQDIDPAIIPGETPENQWLCEPLFIFDCSGVAKTSRTHQSLIIYNNGLSTVAHFDGDKPVRNVAKVIPIPEIRKFYDKVKGLGAWTIVDQELARRGSPMRSVTLFEGATDAKAHTFNYFNPVGRFLLVEEAVQEYIRKHFGSTIQ